MPQARVRHFMSQKVLTTDADVPLAEVAQRMSDARVSCVVVTGAGGVPAGVVTERDFTRAYARDADKAETMSVRSAMSAGVLTLPADARCEDAMTVMKERGVRRIVIVDSNNVLAGVITQTDLLRAHTEEVEVQKQLLEQRVAERTRELEELNTHLTSLSRVDPLLGVGNRRAMDDELDRLESRARRYQRPFAVALVDVDHFKKFNDHYGHAAGDDALKRVAKSIANDIRAADAVYRYGGEEFLVVFPEIGPEGAAIAAEHVRMAIEELKITHEHSPFGHVTASLGVAGADGNDPCWNTAVQRADQALYAAKRAGRNRVELANMDEDRAPAEEAAA